MNKGYALYGLMIVIALLTGLLVSIVFFRRSLAKHRVMQLASAGLAVIALGITLFQTFVRPPLPEAFAQCETPNRFAPTTIICSNRSENYSRVEWLFEEGPVVSNGEFIQRQISKPGTYTVTLKAYGKWPKTDVVRSFKSSFVVEAELPREPETKTVVKHISRSSYSKESQYEVIPADSGFKIVDASLQITSKSYGEARIASRTETEVRVQVTLLPKVEFRGFVPKNGRSWVTADLTLKMERLR